MYKSACLIRNLPESNDFRFVLFVRIKRDPRVHPDPEGLHIPWMNDSGHEGVYKSGWILRGLGQGQGTT